MVIWKLLRGGGGRLPRSRSNLGLRPWPSHWARALFASLSFGAVALPLPWAGILAPMSLLVSPVLVGRGRELEVLMGAFERARAGEPAVVIVGGEAGVGKTRLVEEAAERTGEAGARVLIGSCVELGGEGLPFAPLVDALRELARTTGPD